LFLGNRLAQLTHLAIHNRFHVRLLHAASGFSRSIVWNTKDTETVALFRKFKCAGIICPKPCNLRISAGAEGTANPNRSYCAHLMSRTQERFYSDWSLFEPVCITLVITVDGASTVFLKVNEIRY
jgi:hypothetical protein